MNKMKTLATLTDGMLIAMFVLIPVINVYADNEMRGKIMSANSPGKIQKLADRYQMEGLGEERVLGETYKELVEEDSGNVTYLFGAGYCAYIAFKKRPALVNHKREAEKYFQKAVDVEWDYNGDFTKAILKLVNKPGPDRVEIGLPPAPKNGGGSDRSYRVIIIAAAIVIILFIQAIFLLRRRKKA